MFISIHVSAVCYLYALMFVFIDYCLDYRIDSYVLVLVHTHGDINIMHFHKFTNISHLFIISE